jgi:hypothetical protein
MPTVKSSDPVETGGGGVMVGVSVAVAVTVGVALGAATMVRVGVGKRRVGLSVPGASGGSVASVEAPGCVGVASGDGAAGPTKVQANSIDNSPIKPITIWRGFIAALLSIKVRRL